MAELTILDRAFHFLLEGTVKTGVVPFYTELAAALGLPVEEGRKAVHDLVDAGIPGAWLAPGTDYLASFAPFSNQPTQYRITVDGQQKWFGQ